MKKTTSAVLMIILSFLIGLFLVWPKYQEYREKREELLLKKKELQFQTQYREKLFSLKEEVDSYSDQLKRIDIALKPISLLSFLNYLEELSKRKGLILKNYSYSLNEKENTIDYTLSLSTPYYEFFLNFLSELENSEKLIKITYLSFSVSEEGKFSDFNVKLRVYYNK